MLKNRLFLTFTALALGVSLVGVANAGTINSAMNFEKQQPAQHQTYMTEHNVDAMHKAMEIHMTENNEQVVGNEASTQHKQATDTKQSMTNKDFINQMNQIHDNMNEHHKNMPHHGESHVRTMHGDSGICSGMMGR